MIEDTDPAAAFKRDALFVRFERDAVVGEFVAQARANRDLGATAAEAEAERDELRRQIEKLQEFMRDGGRPARPLTLPDQPIRAAAPAALGPLTLAGQPPVFTVEIVLAK